MIFAFVSGLLAALTFAEPLDPALDWHDCSDSPMLEGRGFPGQGNPYHRLPESQKPRTTEKVWGLSQTSIGFNVRFKTDSDTLAVRWDFPGFHSPLAYMSMVVNLGFSGSGRMELPMADLVADIDASIYILDCLPRKFSRCLASESDARL